MAEPGGSVIMLPPHEEVARIEDEIEALAERIENGRKLSLAARALIGGGAAMIVLLVTGLAGGPGLLVLGIAALLGGFVLLGSNRTTVANLEERLADRENKRRTLISSLEFRTVRPATEVERC